MDSILSVDLGTTAIKVMLFETNGNVLAKSTQEYTLLTPSALAVELPVEAYWEAFKRGLAELLSASKADLSQIQVIGISAQGETLIAVDKQGSPLTNAIVWLDNRAQDEAATLAKHFTNEKA